MFVQQPSRWCSSAWILFQQREKDLVPCSILYSFLSVSFFGCLQWHCLVWFGGFFFNKKMACNRSMFWTALRRNFLHSITYATIFVLHTHVPRWCIISRTLTWTNQNPLLLGNANLNTDSNYAHAYSNYTHADMCTELLDKVLLRLYLCDRYSNPSQVLQPPFFQVLQPPLSGTPTPLSQVLNPPPPLS